MGSKHGNIDGRSVQTTKETLSVGWKIQLMTSYLLLMTFLTNGVQARQHRWKKCANHKGDFKCGLKNSYDDIISAVDDFFDQWGPSTATPIEEVCKPQGRLWVSAEKFNWWHHIYCWWLFWPMGSKHCNCDGRILWTARGMLLKNKPHLFTFNEMILVSLWTFQLTLISLLNAEEIFFLNQCVIHCSFWYLSTYA